jgi:hypothetical protein
VFVSKVIESFEMLRLLFGKFEALVGDFMLETLDFLSFLLLEKGLFLVSRGI